MKVEKTEQESMQVIGSKLLSDPVIQSSVVEQKLPWLTNQESKKVKPRSKRSNNVSESSKNIPKKILTMTSGSRPQEVKKSRHGEPHPIIAECINHVEDEFWKDLLEDVSYGVYPKNFTIRNNSLSFKKSATRLNNLSLIQTDDFEELSHLIIGFISSNANIQSPDDIHNSRILELHNEQIRRADLEDLTWKSIRSVKVQSIHLYNYASRLAEEFNLDVNQVNSVLVWEVSLGGHVDPEDIIFENGVIVHIEGLVVDEENRRIFFDRISESTEEFFIADPLTVSEPSDILKAMDDKMLTYRVRRKTKHTLDKLWNKTLRDMYKDPKTAAKKTGRSHVMSSISMIASGDLEDIESSLITD